MTATCIRALLYFFFFQAEDGIRDVAVTGVQTCALPILGRDPETRYTGSGQAVANFSVATDETYKDRNGERQKRTEWHRITAWGKLAEICQQYLKKGTMVYIEGRIQSREWQDQERPKSTTSHILE